MINNTSTHGKQHELPSFSNIKIYYLSPNTTPYLQSLDQEIINSFKVSILNLLLKLYSILVFLLTFFIKIKAKYRKLLVENRVEEYDISQQLNISIIPVNIRNAIDFVVEAWNQINSNTIKNCWLKTDIILLDCNQDVDAELNFDKESNENDLNSTIQKLPYDDILPALDYIDSDKLIEDDVLLDDDKIVETVWLSHNTEIA